MRDARVLLIGLGTVRGGEKISRRRTVCAFFILLLFVFLCFVYLKADDGERKINFGGYPFGLVFLGTKLGPYLTFCCRKSVVKRRELKF